MRYLTLVTVALLPMLCLAQKGRNKDLKKPDPERIEREALLRKAEVATTTGYLDTAAAAYSRALWMAYDQETCKALAEVHLLRKDTAQYCKYIPTYGDDHRTEKEFYLAHCVREDSVPLAETGLDPAAFPGAASAKRTWRRGSDETNYTLYDTEGKVLVNVITSPTDTVLGVLDDMPEFPEGEAAMFKFLGANTRYPIPAQDRSIQGVVYVNFIVGKDGAVERVQLLRGVHYSMDEESLRVVRSMPPWKPGTFMGKPVRTSYNLPIRYTLR